MEPSVTPPPILIAAFRRFDQTVPLHPGFLFSKPTFDGVDFEFLPLGSTDTLPPFTSPPECL